MFKKIVVASDFSTNAERALAVAIDLARLHQGQLQIVHAYAPGIYLLPPPFDIVSLAPSAPRFEHMAELMDVCAQQVRAQGLPVTTETVAGAPEEAVVAHATQVGADLLVIGSRGLGAIAHALLGSVAEKIVRHSTCPVLVVPGPRS
jgi:nucleotide-binding universal stress UspA family protein